VLPLPSLRIRRWVMSTTTYVSPAPAFRRVSLTRRTSRRASSVSHVVSRVSTGLVSKSVSRRGLWPAAFWILCTR